MRFLKAILPNITIILALTLVVVTIFDRRNPFMGFLSGVQGTILLAATCLAAIATSVVLYCSWRRGD